jgi:hypothetical protein
MYQEGVGSLEAQLVETRIDWMMDRIQTAKAIQIALGPNIG